MGRLGSIAAVSIALLPSVAFAGNDDDVVAGSDVALTGGAVVANVSTGGAMWFNPAGVARLDSRSVGLTGAVLSYAVANAPGILSLSSGEQSNGEFSATQAIPRALTFVASPRPTLRWGIGFFFSRSLSRFVQDSVATAAGAPEQFQAFATSDESQSLYHLSGTVAWKKSKKFLLGGALDIVVASERFTSSVTGGAGDMGSSGTFGDNVNRTVAGGGLQMKLGIQWAPRRRFRLGWMVATPSYLVFLDGEATETRNFAAAGQTPFFEGAQLDETTGTWSGVETGLTRLGGAVIDKWGWLEVDLIVRFPLRTPELRIDRKTKADVRLGGIFRLTKKLKLGAGFFTDFSPERRLDNFGETKVNFYGFTVGFDFANKEKPPERGQDGFYIAFAVAFRYAHGKGEAAGLLFPPTFPPTPGAVAEPNTVGITINEMGINLAIKAGF